MNFEGNVLINALRDKIWKFRTDIDCIPACTPGVKETVLIVPNEKYQAVTTFGFSFFADLFRSGMEFIELAPLERAKARAHSDTAVSKGYAVIEMVFSNPTDGSTDMKWTADINLNCESDTKHQ